MILIERGETIGPANPKAVFLGALNGILTDPVELSFQVFDVSTDNKILEPLQVFPVTEGLKQTVNLVTDKIGTGRFAATWTAGASQAIGRYEIVWFYKFDALDAEQSFPQRFEVLSSVGTVRGPLYAGPADLASEGVSGVSNARILALLALAGRYIERITRRFFEPRYLVLDLDGPGTPSLRLSQPIIALEAVTVSDTEVELEELVIYNRHLRGLLRPDDRSDPRLMFGSTADIWRNVAGQRIWQAGNQNVQLTALLGYTDPDDSLAGCTPDAIRRCAQLLVLRELPLLSDTESRADASQSFRLIEERTRDQSYRLGPGRVDLTGKGANEFTGDPEIDSILVDYMATPFVGSAG